MLDAGADAQQWYIQYTIQTVCVWLGGLSSPVGNHILQELTLYMYY